MNDRAEAPRRSVPWVWLGVVAVMLLALVRQWVSGPDRPALEGTVAPDLSLPLVESSGDRLRLSDLRGEVVLLEFWATWCGACRRATPRLNGLHARYAPRGLRVIGVNTDSHTLDQAAAGHRAFGARFPSVIDPEARARAAFDVHSLPTLVLLDREGVVRRWEAGIPEERDWAATLVPLLP